MKNTNNTQQVTLTLNGREVDLKSINIEGVDRQDYPDFCDAYISEAQWMNDGTELNDEELEQLTEENGCLVNELAHEQMF
jgi:hypothetical protein